MPDISIVIPAYNEAERIAATVRALARACGELGASCEIVVSVEKSADGTLEKARAAVGQCGGNEKISFQVLDLARHVGKGHAVRRGVFDAQGDVVFFTDADLSADTAAIGEFWRMFTEDPSLDGIVGVRTNREGKSPFLRRWLSGCFHWAVRWLTGLPFVDTQCGFKAFRRARIRELAEAQREDGYVFDVEWLLYARRRGWKVAERPVLWTDNPDSHIWLPRDGTRMLWRMICLRRRASR